MIKKKDDSQSKANRLKFLSFNIHSLIKKEQNKGMKKFEEHLRDKAHQKKIKNAKKTVPISSRHPSRLSHKNDEAQIMLKFFQNKNYDSIPIYKFLRTSNLQQYTKGFIERGYGVNFGKLALLTEPDKKKLFQDLKILPGHAAKLDHLISALQRKSYKQKYEQSTTSLKSINETQKSMMPDFHQSQNSPDIDHEYEKQLERVLNEYTPTVNDKKKRTFNSKVSQKNEKKTISSVAANKKYSQTKYIGEPSRNIDFRKKGTDAYNKPTVKRISGIEQNPKESINKLLKNFKAEDAQETNKIMEMDLGTKEIKLMYRSFDGAVMSSTIANIDVEEIVNAFAGFIQTRVTVALNPVTESLKKPVERQEKMQESIEDEVQNILKESYLHPLYRNEDDIEEDINHDEEVQSEGSELIEDINHEFEEEDEKRFEQSSFLGGQSHQFGLESPLLIFNEPDPTELDFFKPTIDSTANFIKNIVLTAKMEREIPIMAAKYLETFLAKSHLELTSLNYKRLLVAVLLLASKVWDDESFETPSFARTFPEYSTILLNEMEKQILKQLDYRLKLSKTQFATIYFKLRKHIKKNAKSYQNKKINLARIRELQVGIKKDYKSNFLTKRLSF